MNDTMIFKAIGSISDAHVAEFAEVAEKPTVRRRAAVWLAPIAACLCIALGVTAVIKSKNADDPHVIGLVCSLNGEVYELSAPDYIERKGLPAEPTAEMLGEYLGEAQIVSSSYITDGTENFSVYDCELLNGTSVAIGRHEDDLFYLVYCNPAAGGIGIDELLEKYGLGTDGRISSITFVGRVITDRSEIAEFIGRFETLSTEEYNELLFSGLTEEEQMELMNKLADRSEEIVVCGEGADTLRLAYIPRFGIAYAANTNYLLKDGD